MGQRLAKRDYVFFLLSLRCRSGHRLEHLVGSKICKTMILGNPSFEHVLLFWTFFAVLNKAWSCRGKWKAQTKRNRGKERKLEHPHCSCCKEIPYSFLSPAWRVVTGKSWGKSWQKTDMWPHSNWNLLSMQRKQQHKETITTQQCTSPDGGLAWKLRGLGWHIRNA